MKAPKLSHCQSCPSKDCSGRTLGSGGLQSKIAFLLGAPKKDMEGNSEKSADYFGAHTDSIGKLFLRIYHSVVDVATVRYSGVVPFFAHAAQCILEKEDADTIKHCVPLVHQELDASGCEVILALGASAMRSLGITGSVDSVRGKIFEIKIGTRRVKVIPTYNPGMLYRKEDVGLVTTLKQDIRKALDVCCNLNDTTPMEELVKGYKLCTTVADGIALCEEIINYQPPKEEAPYILAVDTETTGLEPWLPEFRMIAISFAWGDGKAGAILLDHREMTEDWRLIVPHIQKVLSLPVPKVFHNYQYDVKVLDFRYGWKVSKVLWDTMYAEYLLDECKQGLYGLKEIVRNRVPQFTDYEKRIKTQIKKVTDTPEQLETMKLGIAEKMAKIKWLTETDKKAYKDTIKTLRADVAAGKAVLKSLKGKLKEEKVADGSFENINVIDMLVYACIDTDCCRRIFKQQYQEIKAESALMFNALQQVMLPGAYALGRMEYDGIKVDLAYLDQLEKEFQEIMDREALEIRQATGEDLNLNAAKDIIKLITVKLGIPLTKMTKKAKTDSDFSVDKDVLEGISEKDPLIRNILNWRKAAKAKDTFIANIRKFSAQDGRVHTNYHLTGTSTGRTSSSSPNMQNIAARGILGKNIKKLFIPDNDDEIFVNMDYSGAEIRALCAYAKDPELIKSLKAGLGIHSFVASRVFTDGIEAEIKKFGLPFNDPSLELKPEERLTERQMQCYHYLEKRGEYKKTIPELYKYLDRKRQAAKTTVFLTIYGGGATKLQENLVKEDASITLSDAEGIIFRFLENFPVIRLYMNQMRHCVATQGYVQTKFGRKRRFPLASSGWSFKMDAEKEAINSPIQGTSSDLVIAQLTEMSEHRDDIGMKPRVTVHDSIGFSVPKKNLHLVKEYLDKYATQRITEKFSWMPVPFIYEAEYGPTYGECYEEIK